MVLRRLAGLGIGALAGEAMAKAGLDKAVVEEIKSELKPGTSALLLMGVHGDVDNVTRVRAVPAHHVFWVPRSPTTSSRS